MTTPPDRGKFGVCAPMPPPDGGGFGGAPGTRDAPSEIVKKHLSTLEKWARDNERQARRETLRFWVLKTLAAASSASAGVLGQCGMQTAALISGAIGGLCVVIDGLCPGGAMRSAHHKAFLDLRQFQQETAIKWDQERLKGGDENALAQEILRNVSAEIKRVAAYVRDAETALGADGGPQTSPANSAPGG